MRRPPLRIPEDVLVRQGPAPPIGASEHLEHPGGHQEVEAPLHRPHRTAELEGELGDGDDAALAVGEARAGLAGGVEREPEVEGGAAVGRRAGDGGHDAVDGGLGGHAEQAEAVGGAVQCGAV